MEKTLGGDRLGSGKRQKIELHNYERSTHDLGYLWRSTMSAGTLVPFMTEVALPGDTFDIDLDCYINTHPTIGPLFGSFKVQLDVFQAPIRLYNSWLHNNKLKIGMNMANVKLPQLRLTAKLNTKPISEYDINTSQINPSNLLSYLGIRGVGSFVTPHESDTQAHRNFNGIPYFAFWDIYKQYYANKQEEIGMFINTNEPPPTAETVTSIEVVFENTTISTMPNAAPGYDYLYLNNLMKMNINYTYPGTAPNYNQIMIMTKERGLQSFSTLFNGIVDDGTGEIEGTYNYTMNGILTLQYWEYGVPMNTGIHIETFNLEYIDKMREILLETPGNITYELGQGVGYAEGPYFYVDRNKTANQQGLPLKTYQSDIFNNWLSTEWIDGVEGINSITAVDTSTGNFTLDQLLLSKKVYNMLNRIAVSGGTYDDWLDAVYTHERTLRAETPIYHGGLSKELVFQEVISNTTTETTEGSQPLGTLAGKGIMSNKHKGGKCVIKIDEPSYIIGIVSLTPRIDYSQGNKWDTHLETMDDFHKPALDQIGFQDLLTENMAYWDTHWNPTSQIWETNSAGKQPAWLNYMTNYNRIYGNFAIENEEMFMTLNRKYEADDSGYIKDLTTYIDPSKFNFIFAETRLDSQNFWVQISVDITARRKMSAKVMPNL